MLLENSSHGFIVGYTELLKSIQNDAKHLGTNYVVAPLTVGLAIHLTVTLSLANLARGVEALTLRRTSAAVPIAVPTGVRRDGAMPTLSVVGPCADP